MKKFDIEVRRRAYILPWHFIWIGWVIERRADQNPFYADNVAYYTMEPTTDVIYFTIGFSKNRVDKRIEKYLKKLK